MWIVYDESIFVVTLKGKISNHTAACIVCSTNSPNAKAEGKK